MNINKKFEQKTMTLALVGRLDTTTAPEFEKEIDDSIDEIEGLILDFTELEYVSSAGLRVLLKAQKLMSAKGDLKLIGVNETVMEVLEITGFVDILTIE